MVACLRRLLDAGIKVVGNDKWLQKPDKIAFLLRETLQNLQWSRAERLNRARKSVRLLENDPRYEEAKANLQRIEQLAQDALLLIKVARQIHEEIQLTPWYLSSSYHGVMDGKLGDGRFAMGTIGDPSGRGEAFSYIPRPKQQGKTFKEVVPTLPPALQMIIKDAQWLKLSVAQMNDIITWLFTNERRRSLANLASRGYEVKDPNELLKLNRGPKRERVQALLGIETAAEKSTGLAQYRALVQRTWDVQVNVLSNAAREEDVEAKEEEDEEDLFGDDDDVAQPVGRNNVGSGGNWGGDDEGDYESLRKRVLDRLSMEQMRKAAASESSRPRPTKVVKRLIKGVDKNGKETYRVEFLVTKEDVERVQWQQKKRKEEEYNKQKAKEREKKKKKIFRDDKNTLRLTRLKRPAPHPQVSTTSTAEAAGGGAKLLLNLPQLFEEQMSFRQQRQEENFGRIEPFQINPSFRLARCLEEILMKVQDEDRNQKFPLRDPSTDTKAATGLMILNRRIQRFSYKQAQEFSDDLQSFLDEVRQKYGEGSELTQLAGRLVMIGQGEIQENRKELEKIEEEVEQWYTSGRGKIKKQRTNEGDEGEEEVDQSAQTHIQQAAEGESSEVEEELPLEDF